MLAHAVGKHPQTAPLLEEKNEVILRDIAHQAHENHFTPDNLYGLIDAAVRTAIADARRAIEAGYQERLAQEPENKELVLQMRQEMRHAQKDARVTRENLVQGVEIIRARRADAAPADEPAASAPDAHAAPAAQGVQGLPVPVGPGTAHTRATHQVLQPQGTVVERLLNLAEQIMQQNQALQRQLHPEQAAPVARAAMPGRAAAEQGAGRPRRNSLSTLLPAQGLGFGGMGDLGRAEAIAALRTTGAARQTQAHRV